MFEFRRQLEYKCQLYGSHLVIVDRWYPSSKSCSNCGHKQDLTLADRVYKCENCGHVQDRDENAAVNLKHEGLRVLRLSLYSP
ncbi:MAG: zinc ribbon domain-containing protein [Microcoleus sp.]